MLQNFSNNKEPFTKKAGREVEIFYGPGKSTALRIDNYFLNGRKIFFKGI